MQVSHGNGMVCVQSGNFEVQKRRRKSRWSEEVAVMDMFILWIAGTTACRGGA